jgi:hypothetical protein
MLEGEEMANVLLGIPGLNLAQILSRDLDGRWAQSVRRADDRGKCFRMSFGDGSLDILREGLLEAENFALLLLPFRAFFALGAFVFFGKDLFNADDGDGFRWGDNIRLSCPPTGPGAI